MKPFVALAFGLACFSSNAQLDLNNCTANGHPLGPAGCDAVRRQSTDAKRAYDAAQRPWPGMQDPLVRPFIRPGVDLDACTDEHESRLSPAICLAGRNYAVRQAEESRDRKLAEAKKIADQKAADEAKAEAERTRLAALPPVKMYRFERPAPRGQHHWSWHEGVQFGYHRALSTVDALGGQVTSPLLLIRYQGKQGSTYSFLSDSPAALMTCAEPCENMKFLGPQGLQVIPIAKGSVLSAMVEDARNGWLKFGPVITSDPNYKFDE